MVDGAGQGWLADTFANLLEDKYGRRQVPGVRKISADISAANYGQKISHGHVHHILTGEADNLTDRTRSLLARFFGHSPSEFLQPDPSGSSDEDLVQVLAARLAAFDAAQMSAIEEAIRLVSVARGSRTVKQQ